MALRNRGGKWAYRFNFQGREHSGTTDLAATRQNKRDAQQIEAQHLQALKDGRNPKAQLIRVREFSDAAEQFLQWAEVQFRQHPNSYRRIATSFASAKEFFGKEPVSLLDEARIEAFKTWRIREHEIRDITLRHDLHALSKFFEYAIRERWTRENPIRKVEIPSDADAIRMHIVTAAEEEYYFKKAASNRDLYDLGRLILNQGMRPDEVLSLRKDDLDLDRRQIHIKQGKSPAARRTLDLTGESCQILGRRLAGISPWVFPSHLDHTKHVPRLNSAHDRLCEATEKAKVPIAFVLYDFRHTFATRMAQAGIDLATLAAILGHNSIRIVQKYVHPTAEHKKAAMMRYEQTQRTEQVHYA